MPKKMHKRAQIGFDTKKYLSAQKKELEKAVRRAKAKLYIEFGGKIIQDKHSSRVLPGYKEDTKFCLLRALQGQGEPIFVVSSKNITRGRVRGDFGTTYDEEALRTLSQLKRRDFPVRHVVISMLKQGEEAPKRVKLLEKKLQRRGIKPYRFYELHKYGKGKFRPDDMAVNPFIETEKKMVFILSPGGGSGKFGICLSQLYHEMARGVYPEYLKFETFPVCDLPIKHPLNLAFMAASADFFDVVMKDARHKKATSYKRDVENYELLHVLARHFKKEGKYLRGISSATSMGINRLSAGIVNDEIVQKEAAAEIARRLVRYKFEVDRGQEDKRVLKRTKKILKML